MRSKSKSEYNNHDPFFCIQASKDSTSFSKMFISQGCMQNFYFVGYFTEVISIH